jgi:hypothetical protein
MAGLAVGRRTENPPLVQYLQLNQWIPRVGDFLVWAGNFKTWYGVISSVDQHVSDGTTNISVIFESLPMLLFTLTEDEQKENTQIMRLSEITTARVGTFSVMQNDPKHRVPLWYI